MKIYSSTDLLNIEFYIGKDLWVEGIDDEGLYQYFRFLACDGDIVTCNIISADIIDDLDSERLWDDFPRYPAEPIDLNMYFTNEVDYYLSDLEIYSEDLNVLTTPEIEDCLQQCLRKLMLTRP